MFSILKKGVTTKGKIQDGNVRLLLRTGLTIECKRPERLGVEYETPWLDSPGSREWNINPVRVIEKFSLGEDYTSGKFVIGKWGTGYRDNKNVRIFIELENVVGFEEITDFPPCEPGCNVGAGHVGECYITAEQYAQDKNFTNAELVEELVHWFQTAPIDRVAGAIQAVIGNQNPHELLDRLRKRR